MNPAGSPLTDDRSQIFGNTRTGPLSGQEKQILEIYFRDFAFLARDPLVPGLELWNLRHLADFWEVARKHGFSDIPYWAVVWPGGRAMASFLTKRPDLIKGRAVLDFACGSGIAGLASSLTGAQKVYSCDLDPLALSLTAHHAFGNKLAVQTVDPQRIPDGALLDLETIDVLIAGDVFYEEALTGTVLELFREALDRKIHCLVADPDRNHRPGSGLRPLETIRTPVFPEIENVRFRDVTIYEVLSIN